MTSGPDGIPSFLLKDCANVLTEPLFVIFNLILKKSTFPTIWKNAAVTPVFKKGDASEISNYRPISIISNFAKVFESVLHIQLSYQVAPLISEHQHGFIEKRSTITNLATFAQFSAEVIDRGGQVDVIYTDFQKAFDQLDHSILIMKVQSMGFSNSLVALLKSYLLDRQHFVKYGGTRSLHFTPTSGVPQGTILGPLLFLLFINDLPSVLSVQRVLFADDLKLYTVIREIGDCELLQSDLNVLTEWCRSNHLSLNVSKCIVMSYSKKVTPIVFDYRIDSITLERTVKVKDLGITFDPKLSFAGHISDIVAKSFRTYGFIYRNCGHFSPQTILTLYFSLIRSRLEYGCLIWFPIYHIHQTSIESIQRKVLKLLTFLVDGVYPERGVLLSILLHRFNVNSLHTRHVILISRFLINLIRGKVYCPVLLGGINFLVPRLGSRCSLRFYVFAHRTNVLLRSTTNLMCNLFNRLPSECDIGVVDVGSLTRFIVASFGD